MRLCLLSLNPGILVTDTNPSVPNASTRRGSLSIRPRASKVILEGLTTRSVDAEEAVMRLNNDDDSNNFMVML